MNRYKAAFFGTLAALAASLVFHWYGLNDSTIGGPDHAPTATQSVASAAPGLSASATAGPNTAQLQQCRAQLDACRRSSWDMVAKVIQNDAEQRATNKQLVRPVQPDSAFAARFQKQHQALCAISHSVVQQQWLAGRDSIAKVLKQMGTEPWVEQWIEYKLASLQQLGLAGTDTSVLDAGYDDLWRKHAIEVQTAVNAQPMDYQQLISSAQRFWQEEDQLISSALGSQAEKKYREQEFQQRTAIIAGLATLGGISYEQAFSQ